MANSNPKLELLTPRNCQLIFIDHQPQMAFGVQSILSRNADRPHETGRSRTREHRHASGNSALRLR